MERASEADGLRVLRLLVALLGVLGLVALAPQLARAVTVNGAITGQVTNSLTGTPISGATVNLYNGSLAIGQTQTGTNGDYNLGTWPSDIAYTVQFVDTAAGYGNLWYNGQPSQTDATPVTVNGPPPYITVNQALTPDQVTGQLTDQVTGKPLSGVEVELLSGPSGPSTEVAQTTTDGNGDYGFSAIPPGTTYYVEFNRGAANGSDNSAYYGGVSPTAFSVSAGQTTSGIDGQLFTGGLVSGTVTNSAHRDISGVSVRLMNVNTRNYYFATTGSDGTYALDGLPAGSYQVLFEPGSGQDYVYQYYPDKSNAAAAPVVGVNTAQATTGIDASLATGATVSGKVTDAAGDAVSGAAVYVLTYGGDYPRYVSTNLSMTDSNGDWSVDGLPTGIYQVDFSAPNGSSYASQYYNDITSNDPPTAVTLTAGSTTPNINAALTMAGQISGTVKDTTGVPVQGVEVRALDASGELFAWTSTDSKGDYTLTGLSPSASYRVEFSPPQGSSLAGQFYPSGSTLPAATPVPVTVGQTTPNIDETLGEGGSISGVVTDAATGYPIGDEQVLLTDNAGNEVYPEPEVATEPDGSYTFTHLPPGAYKVEFYSVGGLGFQFYNAASTLSAANSVTVGAGRAVTGIDAALSEGGTLEGHVRDAATGQGIADAEVEVVDASDNFLAWGSTDPNGYYEIPGIAPGSYYVQFLPTGGPPNYQELFYGDSATLAGATPVTIAAGATTAGIDGALALASATSPSHSIPPVTPATTPPITTPAPAPTSPMGQVTRVMQGAPRLLGGFIAGLANGRPLVRFRLASGANRGHKLRSFKVRLPAGLSFVASQLRRGVKVLGGGNVTEKLIRGQLVVTLRSPASEVTVSISSPALKITRQLVARAAHKRAGKLRVTVTVTPVNAGGRMLSFTVKNPA